MASFSASGMVDLAGDRALSVVTLGGLWATVLAMANLFVDQAFSAGLESVEFYFPTASIMIDPIRSYKVED